ncbi:hypothetical protein V8E55_008565 [Tylopilus felleus]
MFESANHSFSGFRDRTALRGAGSANLRLDTTCHCRDLNVELLIIVIYISGLGRFSQINDGDASREKNSSSTGSRLCIVCISWRGSFNAFHHHGPYGYKTMKAQIEQVKFRSNLCHGGSSSLGHKINYWQDRLLSAEWSWAVHST